MIKLLSLFSGIGAFEKALQQLKIEYELVNYCDIDKFASRSYSALHGVDESFNLWDVSKIKAHELANFDILTHGSPCQDFSISGSGRGGDQGSGTRSSLMWKTVDIIKAKLPQYVIWENVPGVLSKKHIHNFHRYLQELNAAGYDNFHEVLNASGFGIPQNRKRVFVVSIRSDLQQAFSFPMPQPLEVPLSALLEPTVDKKYFLSEEQQSRFIYKETGNGVIGTTRIDGKRMQPAVHREEGIMSTLSATDYKRPQQVMIGYINNNRQGNRVYLPEVAATLQSTTGGFAGKTELYVDDVLRIKENTKKGYKKAGAGDGILLDRIGKARGVVQQQRTSTLQTKQNLGVVIDIKEVQARAALNPAKKTRYQNGRTLKNNGEPMFTLTTNDRHGVVFGNNELRIRKLTPLECWRLMGFSDDDYYRIKNAGISDTQAYKQAGNSIVVPVLVAIFEALLLNEQQYAA